MNLRNIAWQSLRRRQAKAGFVLLGLTIGVAAVVAVLTLSDSLTRAVNHHLEKYGANMIITPKSEHLSLAYEGLSLGGFSFETNQLFERDLAAVRSIKNAANVAAVGPVLLGAVQISSKPVLLAGIDFKAARMLKPWWQIEGKEPQAGQVLIGAKAAEVLGLKIGGKAILKNRELTVSGVLASTGSQDDDLLFVRLSEAQDILEQPGRISMAEVAALCIGCPIEEMVRQISEAMPQASVMAIMSVVKGRLETLDMFRKTSTGASVLMALVGGLVVLVTMMGTVRDRTVEIGILRAIGYRRRHVMTIILLETAIVSATAGLLGWLIGLGVAGISLPILAETQGHVTLNIQPWVAGMAMALSMCLGLLAGYYPASMAARMDPAVALRSL
ncbi:MAG: ABC transporter permease [Deltaproteobacteria bacterium]|nr:ABC transporter permease [Deltaproteobacteria bacterium]